MRKILAILLIVFSLAACNLPRATPGLENPPPCYFNWATQALPDLSRQIQSKIDAARLTGVTVLAEAYGENCYDSTTNKPVSFAVLETDLHFSANVTSLTNKDDLGNLLGKLLKLLDDFPTDTLPGHHLGLISVSFHAGSEELNLSFSDTAGKSACARGLHGAELFDELNKK